MKLHYIQTAFHKREHAMISYQVIPFYFRYNRAHVWLEAYLRFDQGAGHTRGLGEGRFLVICQFNAFCSTLIGKNAPNKHSVFLEQLLDGKKYYQLHNAMVDMFNICLKPKIKANQHLLIKFVEILQ